MNEEIFKALMKVAVQSARKVTDDQEALEIKCLYKQFTRQIGNVLKVGEYIQYGGKLYRVLQEHTCQAEWTPDISASLYVVIDKQHKGTIDDPIPAQTNMEYFNGKYYIENDILYLCIRDSGIALHSLPSTLVGNYFEIVEENNGNDNNGEIEDGEENGGEVEPPKEEEIVLDNIEVIYTPTKEIYSSNTLDDLVEDLKVLANYSDGTQQVIEEYILEGEIVEGISVITIVYEDKRAIFDVVVLKESEKPEGEDPNEEDNNNPIVIDSIIANYTQTIEIYPSNSLDDLMVDLVVLANYSNGSQGAIEGFTLEGELIEGTSIITVIYEDKNATFEVLVSKEIEIEIPEQPQVEGTIENPILAEVGMVYYNGKYYKEGENIYLCIRDSGNALYHLPSALVGNYFNLIQ